MKVSAVICLKKIVLFLLIVLIFSIGTYCVAVADFSSGWKGFKVGVYGNYSDGIFEINGLRFDKIVGDISARFSIKNLTYEERSLAVNLALFNKDKELLIAIQYVPEKSITAKRTLREINLKIPGSGEVFYQIRYFQISIVERIEKD